MKKIMFFAAALTALFTSCSSDNDDMGGDSSKDTSKVTASIAQLKGTGTRVALGTEAGNTVSLNWEAEDEIYIQNADGTYGKYKNNVQGSSNSEEFIYSSIYNDESEIKPDGAHTAYYPAVNWALFVTPHTFYFPENQNNREFKYCLPMMAKNNGGSYFSFEAMAAVLHLKIKSTSSDFDVEYIKLKSESTVLSGSGPLNGSTLVPYPDCLNYINYFEKDENDWSTNITIKNDVVKDVYLVVPAQIYPAGDLTFEFVKDQDSGSTSGGNGVVATKTSTMNMTLEKGRIYDINLNVTPQPAVFNP